MKTSIKVEEFFLSPVKDGLKFIISKIKKNILFKKYFINSANELVFNNRNSDFFDENMQAVFSYENLKDMAKKCSNLSGYDIEKELDESIKKAMDDLELDSSKYEFFKNSFINRVKFFLKEKYPDLYNQCFLYNLGQNVADSMATVIKKLDAIVDKLELNNKKLYENIIDYEVKLSSSSKKNITLDFFKIDDNYFKHKFEQSILENSYEVKIRCFDIEESLYSILNELNLLNIDKKVRIVENEDAWNELFKRADDNCIYIAYFNGDNIPAIPNSTSIFFYDEDSVEADYLILRRKRSEILISDLVSIGYCEKDAKQLVFNTNGVFCCLKKELFYGKYDNKYPDTIKNDDVLKAICIGAWVDSELDKDIFANYKELKKYVNTYYSRKNNPLFLRKNTRNYNDYYTLANRKKALFQYASFCEPIFEELLNDMEVIMCSQYSNVLKSSILMNLLIIKNEKLYYSSELLSKIENVITKLYYNCSIEVINDYSNLFLELSPKHYTELFEVREKDVLAYLNTDTGIQILSSIRTLLKFKEYSKRLIDKLFKLHKELVSDTIKKQIGELLKDIFLVWINIAAINSDDKFNILSQRIKSNEFIKEIIYSGLTENNVAMPSRDFYYLNIEFDEKVTNKDVFYLLEKYLTLFINNASTHDDVIKGLELLAKSRTDYFINMKGLIISKINKFEDEEKELIYSKIIDILYEHRFYKDSSWARNEQHLKVYCDILDDIVFDNELYKYKYLFKVDKGEAILNPVSFETNNHFKINQGIKQRAIEDSIKMVKDKGCSLSTFLSIFHDEACNIGLYIYDYYDNKKYSNETMEAVLNTNNKHIIRGYMLYFANNDYSIFLKIIKKVKEKEFNCEFISDLWTLVDFKEINEDIENELEEVKNSFWKKKRFYYDLDENLFEWVRNNYIKYDAFSNYLELLYHTQWLTQEDLYKCILDLPKFKETRNDNYYLHKLFGKIYNYVKGDSIKFIKMAEIEFSFNNSSISESYIFVEEYCSIYPKYYLEYFDQFYIHEGEYERKEFNHKLYSFFLNTYFCPGKKNGTIDENIFNKWIIDFKKGMKEQKQEKLIDYGLGKVFGNSPQGLDGFYPHEIIRKYIEDNYSNDLQESYIITLFNNRGVYTVNGGDSTMALVESLEKNACMIREDSPKTAKIYDQIASEYKNQATRERNEDDNV